MVEKGQTLRDGTRPSITGKCGCIMNYTEFWRLHLKLRAEASGARLVTLIGGISAARWRNTQPLREGKI